MHARPQEPFHLTQIDNHACIYMSQLSGLKSKVKNSHRAQKADAHADVRAHHIEEVHAGPRTPDRP